ncbi:MAG: exodeoxyribonuclease V subunit alpha [Betaproteobacteria bacterium]|nr:exodeoxyribonuclease V subunit alpha [Betaproteobacteria bacterium]NBY06179.1 exodeoxyribonuclease V subunit alpha [Betaproteobacteria bacterium]
MNAMAQTLQNAPSALRAVQALTPLDRAWVDFLCQLMPPKHPSQIWLAALASHQWGRGHACLDIDALQSNPGRLLAWPPADLQALPHDWDQAMIDLPWTEGAQSPLVLQAGRLYLRRAWRAETQIVNCLQSRRQTPRVASHPAMELVDALFGPADPQSTQHSQRQACVMALQHPTCIITGGPGTGKTTTVTRLLALLQAGHGSAPLRILLAAPTGKAAARLNASMAQAQAALPAGFPMAMPSEAQTLHKMLGWSGKTPAHHRPRPLRADVVVVDEASMIDLEMMARLLQAIPAATRLILLGDKDQLASVEAGAVLAQLCEGPLMREATATLTHSHRFGRDSAVGQWAQAVNSGDRPRLQSLWQSASAASPNAHPEVTLWHNGPTQRPAWDSATVTRLRAGWKEWLMQLQKWPITQDLANGAAQIDMMARQCLSDFARLGVLCALREGPWGVHAFNLGLARCLGLPLSGWYAGRPVVITRNDPVLGLMNGDVGLCLPCYRDGAETLAVAFPDGPDGVRWVALGRMEHVDTALAMTVHQSQGSEFERVLLVLPDRDAPVLTRELIYTGITRARQHLGIWVAQPEVWWSACQRITQRNGGLAL